MSEEGKPVFTKRDVNDAVRFGRLDRLQEALNWVGPGDIRVDPTETDNWAVRFAAHLGHTEIVKALLK